MRRSKVWAAFYDPKGRRRGEPPSLAFRGPAAAAMSVTGGGSGNAAGCTHSVLPSMAPTKRCVPKHTVVPGSQEMVVQAIRRVLGETNVDALNPFLERQLSMFCTPASRMHV